MKKLFFIFSLLLLIYMVWPVPSNILQFNALPDSKKSVLEGDTIQIPNVAAYFSNNYRESVVPFYKENFQTLYKLPFPPLELNHPPEFSWKVIKTNTDSTYLEELVYPLKGSLFVNGFEPFYQDGTPKFWGAIKFEISGNEWFTKTTLRFFPSALWVRLLVWLGITTSIYLLTKLWKEILIS